MLRAFYGYDGLSRRVSKTVWKRDGAQSNGQRPAEWVVVEQKYFIYEGEGWNLAAEIDGQSGKLTAYAWGTDLSGTLEGAGGVGGLLGLVGNDGKAYAVCTEVNGNVMGLVNGPGEWGGTARSPLGLRRLRQSGD